MLLATINKSRQLLYLTFVAHVGAEELRRWQKEMPSLISELNAGFLVLTDLGRLDSIEPACAPIIGEVMELCDHKGVSLVLRVIPDSSKDIGLNILSLFHYRRQPRVVTCKDMVEAAKTLSL